MRFLSFVFIITLSQIIYGQSVLTNFTDTAVYDDFSSNTYNFPQKYNALEISIIEEGNYRIKRMSSEGQSLAYLKAEKPFYGYEVSANMTISNISNSSRGGLILNGQTDNSGAIIVELNTNRQFRAYKLNNSQFRLLSGSPKNDGWIKNKLINKKGSSKLSVKVEGGYYDIYINDNLVYTLFDTQFDGGRVGITAGEQSEILVSDFTVKKEKSTLTSLSDNNTTTTKNGNMSGDASFQEVILLFKTKIDQQQVTLAKLQREVDQCRSMLTYDTALVSTAKQLEIDNKYLHNKLDSTSRKLSANKKRLKYLESLREDIEKGANGDLVLNLTSILADIKKENNVLQTKADITEDYNLQLKKDNEVLLREIERMKYLLNIED
jgi:flagellar biosynthesis chaperone FliJ